MSTLDNILSTDDVAEAVATTSMASASRSMIDQIFDEEMDGNEELQAFKRRHPHPSLSYQARQLARGQITANNTGPNSKDDNRKMPALDTSTSASASTPCQGGDGLLLTSAGVSNAVGTAALTQPSGATVVKNPLRESSERETMYVTDAVVVLPPSIDEEEASIDEEEGTEPEPCRRILLFGGVIFLLMLVFVFGIVFNSQTVPILPTTKPALDFEYRGAITSRCKSDLDDEIGEFKSPEECWKNCALKYPDSLVAIDFDNENECHCQDGCDCMANLDDASVVYALAGMTFPPDCSSSSPNIGTTSSSPTLRLPSLLPTASPSGDRFVVIHSKSTFDDAIKYCNSMGRELAQIYTEEENKKAMEACGDNECWIGLIEIGGNASTPISSQTWEWLNGREVVYTNWDLSEPNNYNGIDERYGSIRKGKW
eukprot:CAMPEP_0194273332 /NCGR_PEP_ID=MMETSP0169-20130528/6683_1 /TAXON_ID=218684 /ORGANISM="Corethron pennatum, Strain L29A3" /LENGTH=426 /DNA_ID=CAMNT_0039016247 /DNA_START=166 /DNA_END=1443 /DNA_ORIENTATION=+